jgi:hypothetical protein
MSKLFCISTVLHIRRGSIWSYYHSNPDILGTVIADVSTVLHRVSTRLTQTFYLVNKMSGSPSAPPGQMTQFTPENSAVKSRRYVVYGDPM